MSSAPDRTLPPGLTLPTARPLVDQRVLRLCLFAGIVGLAAAGVAQLLTRLIALCTNAAFFGTLSTVFRSPAQNTLGLWVLLVPVAGGLVVGLMARFGSPAIRGHGIPEAMEQVLLNKSRIPPRMVWLKPLSAAISIGTGGPFGAEGPIIATGGALGSLLGQLLHITAEERKTLLAAGAAAGMTATFGSPVAAVLLAVELLLFELRPRSLVPVAIASVVASAVRIAFAGTGPSFPMPDLHQPGEQALIAYALVGAAMGFASVGVTKLIYAIEDLFEKLPLHWMWWPALGGLAIGLCGLISPRTLGVGYDNLDGLLDGSLAGQALAALIFFKGISWAIALGSGTSGGTLAPLFTLGGGLGALATAWVGALVPSAGLDPRIGALVGMAALFAGASRAPLASVVFAFEITRQPLGLLPLLAGCSISFLLSCLLMKNSIMTEKIARRGVRVPGEQGADYLDLVLAARVASKPVVSLAADTALSAAQAFLHSHAPGHGHQGFPVVDAAGQLIGVLTRRDLLDPQLVLTQTLGSLIRREPVIIFSDSSLREAADQMVRAGVGRLPVVDRTAPRVVLGMLSRSDLLAAHARRLDDAHARETTLAFGGA